MKKSYQEREEIRSARTVFRSKINLEISNKKGSLLRRKKNRVAGLRRPAGKSDITGGKGRKRGDSHPRLKKNAGRMGSGGEWLPER